MVKFDDQAIFEWLSHVEDVKSSGMFSQQPQKMLNLCMSKIFQPIQFFDDKFHSTAPNP